jgi:predicted extracellular nuclease
MTVAFAGQRSPITRLILILAVLFSTFASLLVNPQPASAASTITQWNFNSNPADADPSTGIITPATGSGTASLFGGTTATFASGDAGSGSSDPATGDDSGWNSTTYAAQGAENEARGVQFNVSTVGQQNIVVTWDQRHSNTSARHVRFQYSTDGTTFTNVGNLFEATAGDTWFNNRSVDLSSIAAVNNNANFAFRIVAAFAPSTSAYVASNPSSSYGGGTWRFDMVTVSGDAAADSAPSVASTNPTANATNVTVGSNIAITFSEAVNADTGSFRLRCGTSVTDIVYSLNSAPATTYTINPNADLPAGETCTVEIFNANVTDTDSNDPPNEMASNVSFSFTTEAVPTNQPITATATPPAISTVVGTASSSALSATDPDSIVNSAVISGTAPAGITLDSVVAATTDGGNATATLNVATTTAAGNYSIVVRFGNNESQSFDLTVPVTVNPPGTPCTAVDTPINQIQGTTNTAALTGVRTVQGVVVGDYEGAVNLSLRGFYLQEITAVDSDPASSEALFIFNNNENNNVSLGQVIQVTGTVSEFQGQTQIRLDSFENCGTTANPTPVLVELPFPAAVNNVPYLERFEGMLVRVKGASNTALFVTEHFQLGQFGQVVLSSGDRLFQPTNLVAPGAPAQAEQAKNDLNRIILDDALQNQNRDPIAFGRGGNTLTANNTLRIGDSLSEVVGVLNFTWGGANASPNAYRVRSENALGITAAPNFLPTNPRPTAPPSVGGRIVVSAYNVLNYFLTPDTSDVCGPTQNVDCRGADTLVELTRQRDKLLQALKGLNADVLGLVELENTPNVNPQADLVTGLNSLTAAGTFAAIDTGVIGTDAIRVGLIYKPGVVTPVGAFKLLDSTVDPRFDTSRSRPALAQTFRENATGETFTVVVNHFKSKGDSELFFINNQPTGPCAVQGPSFSPDCDQGDGQAFWNDTRKKAAQALVDWVSGPTFTDRDVLIIGDLNAYAQEDPIKAILAGTDDAAGTADDFVNLQPDGKKYSFVFGAQSGSLDHILASPSMARQFVKSDKWHINADEPRVLDYNTEFKSVGQQASLYAVDPFRTSDHDPILVGLNQLATGPQLTAREVYDTGLGGNGAEIVSIAGNRILVSNAGDGSTDVVSATDLLNAQRLTRITGLTDLTSVAIHPNKDLFVTVAGRSSPRAGTATIYRLSTGLPLNTIQLGRQPDSVEISPDGRWAIIAIEAEAVSNTDDGGNGAIAVIDLGSYDPAAPPATLNATFVALPDLSGQPASAGFSAGRTHGDANNTPITNAPGTLEPEGIGFSSDSAAVYLTLQENNAIARLDLNTTLPVTLSVGNIFGLTRTVHLADLTNGGGYNPTQQLSAFREPDGVRAVEIGGTRYLLTADEGDTRNAAGSSDPRGGRTMSIFNATTGAFVADTAGQLDSMAAHFGVYPDTRSNRGGSEPEMLDVRTFNGRVIAAVGLERGNAVALVDISDPTKPNVFSLIQTGNAPEGIKLVERTGQLFVLSANEVSGNVTISTVPVTPLSISQVFTSTALPLHDLYVIDPDTTQTITVGLSLPATAGILGGPSLNSLGAGSYRLTGTVAAVNTALAGLVYTPTLGLTAPVVVSVSVNDGIATPVTGTVTLRPFGVNLVPTLTSVASLGTLTRNQPFTITYDLLSGLANEADLDGDPLSFRIEAVVSGTLTKGGQPVAPGTTTIAAGEQVVFTPTSTGNNLPAFRVVVTDGKASSTPAVVVPFNAVRTNVAPTIANVLPKLGNVAPRQPITITFEDLVRLAGLSDADLDPLTITITTLGSGSLTKGGQPVVINTTTLRAGESLVFTPGAVTPDGLAFSFQISDGLVRPNTTVEVRFVGRFVQIMPVVTR